MAISPAPLAVSADVVQNGIVVTFSDDRTVVFSNSLLSAMLPQAEELFDDDGDGRDFQHPELDKP